MGVPVGEQQANEESACDAQIKIDVAPVEEAVGHLFLKHLNGFREHRKYTLAAPNSTGDEHLTVFKSIISLDSKFISCEQSSM